MKGSLRKAAKKFNCSNTAKNEDTNILLQKKIKVE